MFIKTFSMILTGGRASAAISQVGSVLLSPRSNFGLKVISARSDHSTLPSCPQLKMQPSTGSILVGKDPICPGAARPFLHNY